MAASEHLSNAAHRQAGPTRVVALAFCGLIALAHAAAAQTSAQLPVAGDLPAGARAAALGGAYLLTSPDADAIFSNPALVDDARGVTGSVSRFGGASQLIAAAGSIAWWKGGLGFGAASLSYGAPEPGRGALARGEDALWEAGPLAVSEQMAIVSYARTLFKFRVGGAGRLIDQRLGGEHRVRGAADAGVARGFGPVTLGFAARNLGPSAELAGADVPLPLTMTASAATRSRAIGPIDIAVAGFSSWRRRDFHEAGGGAEIGYWPISGRTFLARVGYRWVEASRINAPTIGAGFSGDRISIDYAYEHVDGGRPTHRIALRLR